jgi:hypothetical protein
MNILSLEIPDVKVLEPRVHGDSRGYFLEMWSKQKFDDAGPGQPFKVIARDLEGSALSDTNGPGKTCQMYSRRSI